jgi:superoxide reductase
MQRRNLGASALAGAALAVSLPLAARAQSAAPDENVIFTGADPGHWAGVESLHVPAVTVASGTLTVTTPHPMSAAHYIVSHSVVLGDGTFVSRQTFTPMDKPVSTHALPAGYTGPVVVTSTCNRHDFWVTRLSV